MAYASAVPWCASGSTRADFLGAARLLGRRYTMMGRVAHGEKLGRTLGFPTANLRVMRRKPPMWGVMAVRIHGIADRPLGGVASLGTRPTVNGQEPLLETYVFDFEGDLYGRLIEVEFVAKLRDEAKFESLDSMIVQMKIDAAQAREHLVEGGLSDRLQKHHQSAQHGFSDEGGSCQPRAQDARGLGEGWVVREDSCGHSRTTAVRVDRWSAVREWRDSPGARGQQSAQGHHHQGTDAWMATMRPMSRVGIATACPSRCRSRKRMAG